MPSITKQSGYWIDMDDASSLMNIGSEEHVRFARHHKKLVAFISKEEAEWFKEHKNCDLAELEKYFKGYACGVRLGLEPDVPRDLPEPGEAWRHFKGKTVEIIAVSRDSEYPTNECVVYKCPNGVYHRPLEMFMSKVDKCKYPEAQQEFRFEKVSDELHAD